MRLVCPNCDAKYEVPEDAIPETGRDVQCANCGHAWYQMRPRAAEPAPVVPPAPVAAPAPVVPPAPAPSAAPVAAPPPAPEPVAAEPEPVTAPPVVETPAEPVAEDPVPAADAAVAEPEMLPKVAEAVSEPVEAKVEADAPVVPVADDLAVPSEAEPAPVAEAAASDPVLVEEAPAEVAATEGPKDADEAEEDLDAPASAGAIAAAGVSAYAVDESVLAILREEADREAQARKAEAAKPLETQTDLGIDTVLPSKASEAAALAAADATRRTRLPDVEEINSTLRPAETAEEESLPVEAAAVEGRSSFRSGFLLVMTLAILGSALYASADAIAEAVPALAGPLQAYVGIVDSLRLKLDGLMQSATVAINGN